MDFTLTEEQSDIRELADGLVRRRAITQDAAPSPDAGWFDHELWADLARAGLLGIAVDEEFGGSGAGFLEQCLLVEVMAQHAARVPLVESVVQATLPVARFGTQALKDRLLAPLCAGTAIMTSSAHTDASASHLLASHDGEDWSIRGHIDHVVLGEHATAALVPASTSDGKHGWFVLEFADASVGLEAQSSVDRIQRWRLTVADQRIDDTNVLATPGPKGAEVSAWIEAHAVAARCVAQAAASDAALRMTAKHVTERQQFGTPVGSFQAVAHRVADAYIDATAMRLTAWRAAWLLTEGLPATEELAIAAWWATDAGNRVAEASMHLHGGQSVDLDYPLHKYFLAVRHGELILGGPGRRLLALGDIVAVAS